MTTHSPRRRPAAPTTSRLDLRASVRKVLDKHAPPDRLNGALRRHRRRVRPAVVGVRRARPARAAGARVAGRRRRVGPRGRRRAGGDRPRGRALAVPDVERRRDDRAGRARRHDDPAGARVAASRPPRCWCRPTALRHGLPRSRPSGLPADVLLLPEGDALYAVRGATVTPVSLARHDPPARRRSTSTGPSGRWCPRTPSAAIDAGLLMGAGLLAAEQVGVARWALETTIGYLKERRQFGRVVGGFQALKHRLADLYAEVEQADAAARYAAATLATDDPDAPVAVAVAAAFCAEVAVHARRGGGPAARRHRHDVGAPRAPAPQAGQGRRAAARLGRGAPRRARRTRRPARTAERDDGPDPDRGAAGVPRPGARLPRPRGDAAPHPVGPRRAVDLAIIPKMAEIGFFGLTIPEEYGGLGGDYLTYVLGMEELGRADSALRGIVSVSNGLFGKSVLGFGTEEQKQEWLPRIAERHRARLLRPHRAGHRLRRRQPDVAGPPDGTDYVLNGQKLFITNGTWADVRAGLRAHQRRRPARRHGVPGPDRHPRLRGPRDQGQARAARPGHRRAVPLRRPGARSRPGSARRARASRSR